MQQADSETSEIYSELFEEEEENLQGQPALTVQDNSDAESVQSAWPSPDMQPEASDDFYTKGAGAMLTTKWQPDSQDRCMFMCEV